MLAKLYPYRFKAFLFSQVSLLFSSLIVPATLHEAVVSPLLLLINLAAGLLLTAQNKRVFWFLVLLLAIRSIFFGFSWHEGTDEKAFSFVEMSISFVFYIIVSLEIIRQVWKTKVVNENAILGLISGYLSLGLLGFFICMSIEMANPMSYRGLTSDPSKISIELIYYSYVTLLTIGYGDMVPTTNLARTSSVLIGLAGQIYLVIITAVVVGKYIGQHQVIEEE